MKLAGPKTRMPTPRHGAAAVAEHIIYVAGKCDISPHNDGVISNSGALVWSSWRNSEKKVDFQQQTAVLTPDGISLVNSRLIDALAIPILVHVALT